MSNLYPSLQTSISSNSSKKGGSNGNTFFFARVNDILLSTETKTENFFNDAGGWAGLGSIKFTQLGTTTDNDKPSRLIAKPLFTNILQYPILEEIVLILQAPSDGLNTDPQAKNYYYLTTIGLWNSIHHNAFPDIPSFNRKIRNKNDASTQQIEEGSSISDNPDTEVLKFGNSFKEKSDIRNLLPEEGDIIIEGRWGQSIRFSSTTAKKLPNNSWSAQGELGSPITIIRNGQTKERNTSAPWVPIYEDINNDGSSIYMSSGQDIPLELASKNLKSFDVTVGAAFNSALQIPDPYIPSPNISPKQADNLPNSESNPPITPVVLPQPTPITIPTQNINIVNPTVAPVQPEYTVVGDIFEFLGEFTINLRAVDNTGAIKASASQNGNNKLNVYQNVSSQLKAKLKNPSLIIPPVSNLEIIQ
jgi:hypothetical protein